MCEIKEQSSLCFVLDILPEVATSALLGTGLLFWSEVVLHKPREILMSGKLKSPLWF